jgi:hypothetical protein
LLSEGARVLLQVALHLLSHVQRTIGSDFERTVGAFQVTRVAPPPPLRP